MEIIGTGIDLIEVERIRRMLQEHGERFLQRCFTESEQAYADAAKKRRFERYAARFAAKEAVMKALGTGWRDGIAWTDIQVIREPSGKPTLEVRRGCGGIAGRLGISRGHISLSHTSAHEIASAIGCGKRPEG